MCRVSIRVRQCSKISLKSRLVSASVRRCPGMKVSRRCQIWGCGGTIGNGSSLVSLRMWLSLRSTERQSLPEVQGRAAAIPRLQPRAMAPLSELRSRWADISADMGRPEAAIPSIPRGRLDLHVLQLEICEMKAGDQVYFAKLTRQQAGCHSKYIYTSTNTGSGKIIAICGDHALIRTDSFDPYEEVMVDLREIFMTEGEAIHSLGDYLAGDYAAEQASTTNTACQ